MGVLIIRALRFGVYINASDAWELPSQTTIVQKLQCDLLGSYIIIT